MLFSWLSIKGGIVRCLSLYKVSSCSILTQTDISPLLTEAHPVSNTDKQSLTPAVTYLPPSSSTHSWWAPNVHNSPPTGLADSKRLGVNSPLTARQTNVNVQFWIHVCFPPFVTKESELHLGWSDTLIGVQLTREPLETAVREGFARSCPSLCYCLDTFNKNCQILNLCQKQLPYRSHIESWQQQIPNANSTLEMNSRPFICSL